MRNTALALLLCALLLASGDVIGSNLASRLDAIACAHHGGRFAMDHRECDR